MGPNSSDECIYQDIFGLTPGQTYTVTAWVMASAPSSNVLVAIHDTEGNGWVSTQFSIGTSWQQVSQSFTVGANGAMRIHFYELPGSETTWWDDITITGNFSTTDWSDYTNWGNYSTSVTPASGRAKEFIYFNGKVIAIENFPH